jgi:Ca2+/H+ antiporter, TMEM165/GDT1 family
LNAIVLAHAGPTILAAFLAAMVEFVEALTVVLAVGSVRGWRDALLGTGAALGLLVVLVALLGSTLSRIPLDVLQLAVGTLLLLFGMRWLRKAALRAAGVIALHDEAAAFAQQRQLMTAQSTAEGWDAVAFGAAFQITMLEGTEVLFIVIAMGAGGTGLLLPASLGALAALLVVIVLGLAIHRPLARIPENSLKFAVGVLLSAFGSFWVGEGLDLGWPGGDRSIPALVAGFLVLGLLAIPLCRASRLRIVADHG